MAKMIPANRREFHGSKGEEKAFYALRALPDSVTVIHSFRWLHPGNSRNVRGDFEAQGEGDFVIFDPAQGVLVIEVKGGEIWCERGEWQQKNRKTGVVKSIYPEEQASNTVHRIREEIQQREADARSLLFCHAVWFPEGTADRSKLPMNCPSEIVFDGEDLARPDQAIQKAFAYWHNRFPGRGGVSTEKAQRILAALAPTFDFVRSVRQTLDEREEELVQLTREQARIVEFLDEQSHAAVHGAAGTGKTLIAIEKARRLASPNEPLLFLCYNSALKDHLRQNHSLANVHFATFDGFVREIIGPNGTLKEAENDLVIYLLDDGSLPYTHLIIDEAQDFETDWLEALAYKFRDGIFYVFYDRNQLIQREDLGWLDSSPCRLALTRNCRNTNEVARVAYRAGGISVSPTLGLSGPKPSLWSVDSTSDAIETTRKLLEAAMKVAKVAPEDLAILTLEALQSESPWHKLSLQGVAISDRPKAGCVTLTTVRKFKGLEASLVVVADADFRNADDPDWRRRLYVACSRARQAVHIISSTPEKELKTALVSFSDTDKVRVSWRSLATTLGVRLREGEIDDPFK